MKRNHKLIPVFIFIFNLALFSGCKSSEKKQVSNEPAQPTQSTVTSTTSTETTTVTSSPDSVKEQKKEDKKIAKISPADLGAASAGRSR